MKAALRVLEEPIHVFGESIVARKQRLQRLMEARGVDDWSTLIAGAGGPTFDVTAFSHGPAALVELRRDIVAMSLQRAKERESDLKFGHVALLQAGRAAVRQWIDETSRNQLELMTRTIEMINVRVPQTESALDADDADDGASMPLTLGLKFTAISALHNAPLPAGIARFSNDVPSQSLAVTGDTGGVVTVWDAYRGCPLRSVSHHDSGYGRVEAICQLGPSGGHFFTAARHSTVIRHWRVSSLGDDEEAQAGGDGGDAMHQNRNRGGIHVHRMGDVACAGMPLQPQHTHKRLATDANQMVLAATGSDRVIRVFDARSPDGPTFLHVLGGYQDAPSLNDISFHPDGALLSATDGAGRCTSWDLRSGRVAMSTWHEPHVRGPCTAVRWAPCGFRFATGGADHSVLLWDARRLCREQQAARPVRLATHFDYVSSLSFVPLHEVQGAVQSMLAGAEKRVLGGMFVCSADLAGFVRFHETLHLGRAVRTLNTRPSDDRLSPEGPVRGHVWLHTGRGGLSLGVITAAHHWALFGLEGSSVYDSGRDLRTYVFQREGASGRSGAEEVPHPTVGSRPSAPDDDGRDDHADEASDDDDDDDMAALRRRA